MCLHCKGCCKGAGCTMSLVAKILLIIGGVNWGLVGAGMLLGSGSSWNVVSMLLGSIPMLEATIYIVVGVAGLMSIFGCRCKKCSDGVCSACGEEANKGSMTGSMGQNM